MTPLAVSACTMVSALGHGLAATRAALQAGRSGLAPQPFETATLPTWLGLVQGLDTVAPPAGLAEWDCRNNRLAQATLQADGFAAAVQATCERVGPARIGVFLGTSTSGILSTEQAYRRRDVVTGALPADLHYASTHNTGSLARYVRQVLALQGPAAVVSTACSSSAKVFGQAARLIELGLIDAAVVGGVDSLCLTTLYGFHSLELLSPDICRPWDRRRKGLSLGEAGAFLLLERACATPQGWLLGCGESSDGHHMSSPLPDGAGAALAMRQALRQAGLNAGDVDYVNLHGTGTPGNDSAEDRAVTTVFGTHTPCSSTKGHTGHTLGAAGGVEAVIALLALQHGLMPGGLNADEPDPTLRAAYLHGTRHTPLRHVASNSFGFGGSNCCLLFGAGA
ncbi:beta-ketoacyl-[acyl-carrier-protein] synthase family protein [Pseudorhodoferax sp.]|uniref:beta-ketoacyl-[acyl-carrier-protein] synthase family protein n=1 Tax=Pseudorhodoferax sp. TaxID=1993553 RepID=UPI002DD6A76F|nr:beta-ketoacyl-[acyl-carrier-protein] synthase family protein [Pseudorhodoferax sp.]